MKYVKHLKIKSIGEVKNLDMIVNFLNLDYLEVRYTKPNYSLFGVFGNSQIILACSSEFEEIQDIYNQLIKNIQIETINIELT